MAAEDTASTRLGAGRQHLRPLKRRGLVLLRLTAIVLAVLLFCEFLIYYLVIDPSSSPLPKRVLRLVHNRGDGNCPSGETEAKKPLCVATASPRTPHKYTSWFALMYCYSPWRGKRVEAAEGGHGRLLVGLLINKAP